MANKIYNKDNDYDFIIYTPDVTATDWAGIEKGDVITVGDTLGIAVKDFDEDIDDSITLITKTKQALGTKATGTGSEIAEGVKIYRHNTTGTLSTTSSGGTLVGYSVKPATADDDTVLINFDGFIKNVA